jgi:peptidoglycan/xylan/chitin deacetylase (PgdA/CDA1 family)
VHGRALVKRSASRAARSPAFGRFVGLLERAAPPRAEALAVLTYHRVDEPARRAFLYPGLVSATPAEFGEQMSFLASTYRPISLAELLAVRRGEAPLPSRAVLVTFDDAYRDVAEHAWPIMRRRGVPLTLFVPTAFPGEPGRLFWWDRLYGALGSRGPLASTPIGDLRVATEEERVRAFRALRDHLKSLPPEQVVAIVDDLAGNGGARAPERAVLDWEELRRLAGEGVALAPHSRTHPMLDRLPREEARREILESLADLEREVGPTARAFAYPGGGYDDGLAALLAEEGFELGFLTSRGMNDLRRPDWLRLRRINVGRTSGLSLIRLQLLPWWTRIH